MSTNNNSSTCFYDPNFWLTIVAAMLCMLPTCVLAIQTWRYKAWYLVYIPISGVLEIAG